MPTSAHLSSAALKGNAGFGADVIQVFLGALGQLLAQNLSYKGLIKGIVPAWRQRILLTFHKGEERGPGRAWVWPLLLSTFSWAPVSPVPSWTSVSACKMGIWSVKLAFSPLDEQRLSGGRDLEDELVQQLGWCM